MGALTRPESFNLSFFNEAKARRNMNPQIQYVVSYARLSFDEDGEGYCSIVNQKGILENFYRQRFLDKPSQYQFIADDNVTGYSFERAGFFQVLNMIENGTCNILLAKDLSRIGRHSAQTQLFIEQCERVGIRVVAMEDYDSQKESDELTLGIRAWSNERIVKDTSAKILKVVRHKQAAGEWFCAAPYGYIVDDYAGGKIHIDDEAADVLQRIARLYRAGSGVNRIARILSDEHVPTPSMRFRDLAIAKGKSYRKTVSEKWTGAQISKMLEDDFYIGVLRTGKYKRQGINGKDVRTDAAQQHVFADHHPAIFPRALFEEIQAQKERRGKEKYRGIKKNESLFHGLVFCGECGARHYFYSRPGLAGQYVCSQHFKYGLKACTRHTIKESTLIAASLDLLRQLQRNCSEMISEFNAEIDRVRREQRQRKGQAEKLKDELGALRRELEVIESQRIKQIIKFPEREEAINELYDAMHEKTISSIRRLEEELSRRGKEAASDPAGTVKKARKAMDMIDRILEEKTITRQDAELLFEKIIVHEDGRVIIALIPDIGGCLPGNADFVDQAKNQNDRRYSVSYANDVCDGDPLEIYTDHDGEVVLKKYSPIGEIATIAKDYTDSLYRTLGHITLISDRDAVVAVSGASKHEQWEKPLSAEVENLMQERSSQMKNLADGERMLPLVKDDNIEQYTAQIVVPIVADGEVVGCLMLATRNSGARMRDVDMKVAETTAVIIGRQMEQ